MSLYDLTGRGRQSIEKKNNRRKIIKKKNLKERKKEN